jgi:hypothetical protein
MINSVAKADALVRKLQEELGFRLSSSTLVESRDANGWPVLAIGDDAKIRIKSIDAVSKDIFGNSFAAYAPHVLDIAYVADIDLVEYSTILFACAKLGVKIQGHVGADLSVDDAADFALEYDVRFPTKGV